jgi:hypothetical protein
MHYDSNLYKIGAVLCLGLVAVKLCPAEHVPGKSPTGTSISMGFFNKASSSDGEATKGEAIKGEAIKGADDHVHETPPIHDGHDVEVGEIKDENTYAYDDSRKLGVTGAVFLILNKMIGTGIFSTPSSIFAATGSVGVSLMLWVIGKPAVTCTVQPNLDNTY